MRIQALAIFAIGTVSIVPAADGARATFPPTRTVLHCEIQQTNTEYIRTRDALFLCRVYLGLYRFAFGRHSDQADPLACSSGEDKSKSPPTEAALHLLGNPGSIAALAFEHVECPSCRRVQHTADKFWLLAAF
jgi:hypothetical protein